MVLKPNTPDGFETGLQPLTRDKFREVLGDTRSGCHSILRDNEGLQPQEAVEAMVKFLFAKWYDEQSEKPANLSAHVARVKVNHDKVNPYYLAAYLNSILANTYLTNVRLEVCTHILM